MLQSLVRMLVHVIFSTKNRVDLITPEIENDLFGYIHGIVENNNSKLIVANGTTDHIHLLISLGKILSISELIGASNATVRVGLKNKTRNFRSFIGRKVTARFLSGRRETKP